MLDDLWRASFTCTLLLYTLVCIYSLTRVFFHICLPLHLLLLVIILRLPIAV
jgi:hypothetical protein